MSTQKLTAPFWISNPTNLQAMVARLSREPRLAIDTESNSLHAFQEQVCLIQFSIPAADYLVDPLAINDLSPLSTLFSDPSIEKTFHAAEYDLICLKRDFSIEVTNLFDTMQAARILSYPAVGLNNMLTEKFQVILDKRFQKADWAKRPLPFDQLNYARMDTHFLLDLRDVLYNELIEKDLWELAQEEFHRLSCCPGSPEGENTSWQRVNGANRLTPQQLAIFNELLHWRVTQARRMNRPVFKVVGEKLLIAAAEDPPKRHEDLQSLGFTVRQTYLFGEDIISAVKRGLQASPIKRTRTPRPAQAIIDRMEALRTWRKQVAQTTGIDSDIVLPRPFMQSIAEIGPRNLDSLSVLMPASPWRLNKYGQQILDCIQGK